MAHTVTRRNLPVPDLTPDTPDVPRDITALANALGNVATYNIGALASRPTSGQITGDLYRAVDDATDGANGTLYEWTGTAWVKTTHANDPIAGVAGARTLGKGGQQAASGNDDRVTANIQPCRLAATGNVNVSSAPSTFDGVAAALNDHILLWQQTNAAENGVYIFNGTGVALTRIVLVNPSDFVTGATVTIYAGNTLAAAKFTYTTVGIIVVDVTPLTFKRASAIAAVHAPTHRSGGSDPIPEVVTPGAGDLLQAGVLWAGDLNAVARSLAGGAVIDISAGVCWLANAAGILIRHFLSATNSSVSLAANPASNTSRIDSLYAVLTDWESAPAFNYFPGTQTAGAGTVTLDNQLGVNAGAGVPPGSILLRQWLFSNNAGTTTVTTRDRRPWARGFFNRQVPPTGANYSTTSGTIVVIDSTNLSMRVECSGMPLRITFAGRFWTASTATSGAVYIRDNGNAIESGIDNTHIFQQTLSGESRSFVWYIPAPGAGSKLLRPYWNSGDAATAINLGRGASSLPMFTVEELIRPNVNNGTA